MKYVLALIAFVAACQDGAPSTQHGTGFMGGVSGGGGGGGTGTVTSVVGGTGLTGGTITSSGTLAVDPTVVQSRVTTTCSAGQFLTAVAQDGTATCTAEPGDISGVTAGTGLSGGGASGAVTLTVNVAGATCTNGQVMTALGATGTGTCASVVQNQYSNTHLEWVNEFFDAPTTSGMEPPYTTGVAGGTFTSPNPEGFTRPGIWESNTSTSATGAVRVQTSRTTVDFGSGNWTFELTGGWPTLSTAAQEYQTVFGFIDAQDTTAQVDGCYFLYDRGNVAAGGPDSGNADALSCWCSNNSTRTAYLINGSGNSDESFALGTATVAALTLPNTNIHTYKVSMTGTTRAEFYQDGVKVCDINTNIPSGVGRTTGAGWYFFKSNGTTARTFDVDRTRLAVDLPSARTP